MEKVGDFSGGPVIKNPPSKAGDAGLTPHAAGQLSLHNATTEPLCHNEDPVQPKKKKIWRSLYIQIVEQESGTG